ncbi:MAG: hypothetical protein M3083_04175 [Actinomycetota bacterium]|nr:hypothetical protein [Actinomycetota bacterium]
MADISSFLPSINGLRFTNSWPSEPDIVVNVPAIGDVAIGNASNGLCGGMVFTVLDVFIAGLPPLPDPQPAQGSPLFRYIVKRLFDSWNLPTGVLTYYQWMTLPDADTGVWLATLRGVGSRTIEDEWPTIRSDLDAGRPAPLGLVTVASPNPAQLGENHQVLAYGYDLNGDQLTIKVYDPNTDLGSADDVHISLSLANPGGKAAIAHNVGIAGQIRGFFRVPYTRADPSALEPPAGAASV